jgi:hypothetical protein
MNYFQQYETERKHLKVGKMWICDDPVAIAQNIESLGEIIEIIGINDIVEWRAYRYFVLTGKYKGAKYQTSMPSFTRCYKPYTGAKPSENEEVSNG